MAKNNKGAKTPKKPAEAPKVETSVQESIETKTTEKVQVLDLTKVDPTTAQQITAASKAGLDPNHRVELLNMMDRRFGIERESAKKRGMSEETLDNINSLLDTAIVAAFAEEVVHAENQWAFTMRTAQLALVQKVGSEIGITIDQKALPAPKDDGTVEVPASAIKVDKEVAKQIKEEAKIVESVQETDPTKITSDEELKNALIAIMASRTNNWAKIHDAVEFMRSYLANKAKDDEKASKKVENMTDSEIIDEIANVVGRCPFIVSSLGRSMALQTGRYNTPVFAFTMLRNATKDRKTGKPVVDDRTIAEYTRAIIIWSTNESIAELNKKLEDNKNDASVVEQINKNIEHLKERIALVSVPGSEVADNFLENLTSSDEDTKRVANIIFKALVNSYYDDIDVNTCKPEGVKYNAQQLVGYITNLFRPVGTYFEKYDITYLQSLEPIQSESSEEKPKESKKA